ncbi:MAG: hypothetical protein ACOYN3_01245 [Acidimicrobiia bacterium]
MMRSRDDSGFASAQFVVLLTVSFMFLAWFANVLFIQYERAAVRSALADAARQATRTASTDVACAQAVTDAMNRMAKGPTERGEISGARCSGAGDGNAPSVTATLDFNFDPWFPGVPNATGTMSYTAQKRIVARAAP